MDSKINVIKGDITRCDTDAIVNAANSSLMGGGGVDGAIHRAGGPEILDACRKIISQQGSCPTGEAVITTAGRLPARFVIHTVGPVWQSGKNGEPGKLRNCYINSLRLAEENNISTIAFPNISTGVYGYPKEQAARVAIDSVRKFLSTNDGIVKVYFVCFDEENLQLYNKMVASKSQS